MLVRPPTRPVLRRAAMAAALSAALGVALPSIAFALSCVFPVETADLESSDPIFEGLNANLRASYGESVEVSFYDPATDAYLHLTYKLSEEP